MGSMSWRRRIGSHSGENVNQISFLCFVPQMNGKGDFFLRNPGVVVDYGCFLLEGVIFIVLMTF